VQLVSRLRDEDPRRVGPFAIEGQLGGGGFGVVYLGRAKDGSPVAVKVMSAELERGEERREHRQRFRREVEFLTLLSHRFVPAVVESGEHRGRPYLATQFVPGPTLHRLVMRCGPLPVDAVLGLAMGLAEIVHEVHELGVHRDVKPGNVLVTPEGPHLIDFGIAHLHNAVHITRWGNFLGTREYMDPAGGMPADVFGFGGTLLFAATGHTPFDAALPGSETRLPAGPVDFSGVPDELLELLESCLHTTPSQRPRALAVLEQVQARCRTTSFAASLPVAAAQVLERAAAPYTAAPPPSPAQPTSSYTRSVPADPSAGWQCQLADWVQAMVPLSTGQVLIVTADGAVTALAENDGTLLWQVGLPAATTGAVAIAGSRVYAGTQDGYLYVLDMRDGRHQPRLQVGGRVSSCVVVGPQVIAAASSGAVAAFDGATGAHAWDETLPCALTGGLAVTGRTVYAGGGNGVVYAIDTAHNGRISSSQPLGQRIHALAVSACGVHAAGGDGGVISLEPSLEPDKSASGWGLATDAGQVWACRANPATTLVATASVEGVLRVDDAATGHNHLTRSGLGAIRRSLTLHEGTLLVGCVNGSLMAVDVRNGGERHVRGGHSPVDAPAVITRSGVIVGGWLDGTVVGIPGAQ
jgi:outer membrane protein assembly factor BamB/predicted Ser/Thr protein kinase